MFYGQKYVGNVKIGNIHPIYRHGEVGLMVGKPYWGKGIGTAAIELVEEIAFIQLGLHKIYAGVYSVNHGSTRAFLHNGWEIVGEMKEHVVVDGSYEDTVFMEKLSN